MVQWGVHPGVSGVVFILRHERPPDTLATPAVGRSELDPSQTRTPYSVLDPDKARAGLVGRGN
jgi:hypothetical protein